MVWLHRGGFTDGSSIEQIAYEGGNMCKLGQVVVVSVNHRLNILGYCDFSPFGEAYVNPGNAGTEDLVAALKWLHDNIEKLGSALMAELKVDDVKALETVPYTALAAAYNKVMPALKKAGKNVGGTPYVNAFYKGEPVKNGFRKETERVEKLMFDFIMAFAKTGNPENPEVPQWAPCTPEKESTLVIGREKILSLICKWQERNGLQK